MEHLGRLQRGSIPKIPTCGHPTRKHAGKGLCHSCYVARWTREHPSANTGQEWLRRHPEEARLHSRRASLKKLGVTPEQYESLWHQQSGKCANTNCHFEAPLIVADYRKGLTVDHEHSTGKVRGLLCGRCNTALGHVKDDTQRLIGLVDYLKHVT